MENASAEPERLAFGKTLPEAMGWAIDSIGRADFFLHMLELLGVVCPMDAGGAMVFHRNRRPLQLLHRFNPSDRMLPEDYYVSGPYALDPMYHLFLRGAPGGVYWLREIAPDDFFESEFYRTFYSRIGLSDDIFVMWRIDEDSSLLFFLERSVHNPGFQLSDITSIKTLLPFTMAASAKHRELVVPVRGSELDDLTHQKVQSTIQNFASSLLTRRERQVLFYMLQGYSSGTTAQRLDTTEGTIKIHRKNIHRKLDIGSQAELFSLFINCIPFANPGEQTDPLEVYQQRPDLRRGAALASHTDQS